MSEAVMVETTAPQSSLRGSFEIVHVNLTIAKQFVRQHHRHNPEVTGWYYGVGLALDGDLVGVAMIAHPQSKEIQQREPHTVEIVRVAVIEGTKNANSKLYGRACRMAAAAGWWEAITYTRPDESGASLRAAGFVPDEGLFGSREGQKWHESRRLFDDDRPDTSGPKIRWRRRLASR